MLMCNYNFIRMYFWQKQPPYKTFSVTSKMWVREAWERAVGDRPSQPNPEGANSARSSYRLLSAVQAYTIFCFLFFTN